MTKPYYVDVHADNDTLAFLHAKHYQHALGEYTLIC